MEYSAFPGGLSAAAFPELEEHFPGSGSGGREEVGFGGAAGDEAAAAVAVAAAASSDRMELMEARESMECSLPHDSRSAFLTAGLARYVLTAGRP